MYVMFLVNFKINIEERKTGNGTEAFLWWESVLFFGVYHISGGPCPPPSGMKCEPGGRGEGGGGMGGELSIPSKGAIHAPPIFL